MVIAHDTEKNPRTEDVKINHDITYESMLLSTPTFEGLKRAGFYKPSPIQLHGIPLGKCGFDLLLEAKSGTGKTAVFAVIALEKLDLAKGLQTLILAPTREIASQICEVIKEIGFFYKCLSVEVVMGGLSLQEDVAKFKKGKQVHILVGSPGRLRHLIQDKHINTAAVRLLVLDEADKLMEKSFQADINYIYSTLPQQKQVIMSSATYPDASKDFIYKYVNNAQLIKPDTTSVLLGIEQKVTVVSSNIHVVTQTQFRYEELIKIMTKKQFKQCLIFCNYQARVAELHEMLAKDNWPSEQLYGLQEQTDRLNALKTLQEYNCRILISTDLAARGIDASNVDLVINFEPPYDWQTYLHRIGRAGRYGSYGCAVSILAKGNEEKKFKTMLTNVKSSLNISYFWSDEKFSLDHFVPNLLPMTSCKLESVQKQNENIERTNDLPKDEMLNMLWEEIKGTNQTDTNIDDFDTILNSFNKLEPEITTFTNLIQSFENCLIETEGHSSYQHLPMNEIKTNNLYIDQSNSLLQNIYNLIDIMKIRNYSKNDSLDNDLHPVEQAIQNYNGTEDDSLIKQDIDLDENSEELEMARLGLPTMFGERKDNNSNSKFKNINGQSTRNDSYNGSPNNDLHSVEQAVKQSNGIDNESNSPIKQDENAETLEMARLGLPTSFGKRKDKNSKFKERSIYWNNHPKICYSTHSKRDQNGTKGPQNYSKSPKKTAHKKPQTFTNEVQNNKIESYSIDYRSNNSGNEQSRNCSESIYRKPMASSTEINLNAPKHNRPTTSQQLAQIKAQPTKVAINKRKGNKTRIDCLESDSDNSSYGDFSKAYHLRWYKQLKLRTQQLEQLFYLQELSKI